MGWLVYDRSVPDPQAECDRLCTWSREDSSGRVVASSIVGNVYYAAVERTAPDAKPYTFAAVFLIKRSPFGYKDMDESMGPCEATCPRFILEKLSPLPPVPTVTETVECWGCKGTGERFDGSRCFICEDSPTARQLPIPEQADRHAYARKWRARCWSRFGGEPQGIQQELFAA